ncbi:hypothetical protein M569_14782 [Genlisea aurea]|uniref:DUF7054 domain-containing protein n=1 Tax=Genlisea aurea TaxID=192259 RepID=S8DKI8_9LAMI|nr:hypothetical protein M569_14782 [Genlisea aurea]
MNPKLKMGSSSLEKKLSLQKSTKTTEEIKKSVDEKMRRSISDKGLFPPDHSNRYLVIINVVGGTGPIKFLVNRDSNVKSVIEKALKIYNREGRHPAIGSDTNNLYLYPADVIGSDGITHIIICKSLII